MTRHRPVHLYSTPEACKTASVTSRQALYWVSEGLLIPSNRAEGSGHWHAWSVSDVAFLRVLGVVSRIGTGVMLRHVAQELRNRPFPWSAITFELDEHSSLTIHVPVIVADLTEAYFDEKAAYA